MYVHVIGWETAKKDKIDLEGSKLKEKQGLYTCPPSSPQQLPFHCCLEVKEEQIKVQLIHIITLKLESKEVRPCLFGCCFTHYNAECCAAVLMQSSSVCCSLGSTCADHLKGAAVCALHIGSSSCRGCEHCRCFSASLYIAASVQAYTSLHQCKPTCGCISASLHIAACGL